MTTEKPRSFARLRFVGKRFEGPVFPVEVLPDLAAYREIVFQAARLLYLDEHPERKQVPRGFEASFQLVLDHLEEGSSIPVLARLAVASAAVVGLSEAQVDSYFDRARDLVAESVKRVAEGESPPELGAKLGPIFGRFGRGLQGNEKVYFSPPTGDLTDAPFDLDVRKEMMLRFGDEYWSNIAGVGEIVAADRPHRRFVVFINGERLTFKLADDGQYRELFDWLRDGTSVKVEGNVLRQRDGRFKSMEVQSIGLAEEDLAGIDVECSIPISDQLNAFRDIPAGWLEGEGSAYDEAMLQSLGRFLELIVRDYQLPRPYVYPMPTGGISVEWTSPKWVIDLQFNSSLDRVDLIASEIEGNGEMERTFQLDETQYSNLGALLAHLIKGDLI